MPAVDGVYQSESVLLVVGRRWEGAGCLMAELTVTTGCFSQWLHTSTVHIDRLEWSGGYC